MSIDNSPEEGIPLRDRTVPEIVPFLDAQYDLRIVAFALQEKLDLTQLDRFITGEELPSAEQETKMRDMVEIAEILQRKGCTANAIQALMFGKNSSLDGEAPILKIRDGNSSAVVAAAPGFLEGYK
jgi:hypothetical protein